MFSNACTRCCDSFAARWIDYISSFDDVGNNDDTPAIFLRSLFYEAIELSKARSITSHKSESTGGFLGLTAVSQFLNQPLSPSARYF